MIETPADVSTAIVVGVDTHKDTHHAAIVDHLGRGIGDREFPATPAGYRQLLGWATAAGSITAVGVEGTGSYGLGLTRTLLGSGLEVVEVDRPDRRARHTHGKSDPIDAYAAAIAVISGRATTTPKRHDGQVEAIRLLHNTRRLAVKSRAEALTSLKSAIVTCPEPLRSQLAGLTRTVLITTCTGLRPHTGTDTVLRAAKIALRSTAHRIRALTDEIDTLDAELDTLTTAAAPQLRARPGIGIDSAAQLLITVGANADRITSEAALAHLCGVAPLQASSGRTHRHRLNRGGDRQANRALHTIVIHRLRTDARTQAYRNRRRAEHKTNREINRCLKRALAREIYQLLVKNQA